MKYHCKRGLRFSRLAGFDGGLPGADRASGLRFTAARKLSKGRFRASSNPMFSSPSLAPWKRAALSRPGRRSLPGYPQERPATR